MKSKTMANGNIETPSNYPTQPPPSPELPLSPYSQYTPPPPSVPPNYTGDVPAPKPKRKLIKIVIGILAIFFVLFLVAGTSIYFYQKKIKADPISLLPQDTAFYFRIKINPNDPQVKSLKELLKKIPYYDKLSQEIDEKLQEMRIEEPALKSFDFTMSNELIVAFISPIGEKTEKSPYILILPSPDEKKLEKLVEDIQKSIEKDKEWKIEKEIYKKVTIVKAVSTKKDTYPYYSVTTKSEPSYCLLNNHLLVAENPESVKKIIDVAKDQEMTSIFKKNKIKNITSTDDYKKLKKILPTDYLFFAFSQYDFSEILSNEGFASNEKIKTISPLLASLGASINSLFSSTKDVLGSENVFSAGVIIADKDELRAESYYLDSREDAFLASDFNIKNSLANIIPEKIGDREIAFYAEGKNLENALNYIEKTISESMTDEEKDRLEESLGNFEHLLGVDLKNDILSLFKNNYAFFVATDSTGNNAPIVSFIFELEDVDKAKENLLELKIPKIPNPLEESRFQAKDSRIKSNMYQLRTMAEIIYDDEGSYANVRCSYKNTTSYVDIKTICDDIKLQGGIQPIIHQSYSKYCAYAKLNEEGLYACLDNTSSMRTTYINPAGTGYCTNTTFLCPRNIGNIPNKYLALERNSFSKEIVNGLEIYSLPIVDNAGLYFSIRDKNLILAFTKGQLVDVIKSFADSSLIRLKDSDRFKEQFGSTPQNITSISYGYPYGFTGLIKYLTNFSINLGISSVLGMSSADEMTKKEMEIIVPAANELLDKGIIPYLKLLRSAGSYSYYAEKGLTVDKGKLIIQDLSPEEKRATEEFWDNIYVWVMEKKEALNQVYYDEYYKGDYNVDYISPNDSYYQQPEVPKKPEIPGSFEISNLKFNGNNNSAIVLPGQAISINLSYSVWSRTGCPGCIIQLVLGIGDNALGCVYDGGPGIYPGRSGNYSTTVSASQNPGTYYLYMSYAAQYTCSDAMELYLSKTASKIGTIVVSP